jgi:hypothetical protein
VLSSRVAKCQNIARTFLICLTSPVQKNKNKTSLPTHVGPTHWKSTLKSYPSSLLSTRTRCQLHEWVSLRQSIVPTLLAILWLTWNGYQLGQLPWPSVWRSFKAVIAAVFPPGALHSTTTSTAVKSPFNQRSWLKFYEVRKLFEVRGARFDSLVTCDNVWGCIVKFVENLAIRKSKIARIYAIFGSRMMNVYLAGAPRHFPHKDN